MTTTDEVAAFIAREFPQTKCGVREVGQGGAVVFHEIGSGLMLQPFDA